MSFGRESPKIRHFSEHSRSEQLVIRTHGRQKLVGVPSRTYLTRPQQDLLWIYREVTLGADARL